MTLNTTSRHFDRLAENYYERNYRAPSNRHERALALRRELCLDLLHPSAHRVLDLGCGPGAITVPLVERGCSVVALDLSPRMVEEARRLVDAIGASDRCMFCVGDAAALPFEDASFDAVVTTGVLEYVPDLALALRECARVLRPGGALIATASLPRRLERAVVRHVRPIVMRALGRENGSSDPTPFHRALSWTEFDRKVAGALLAIDARRFSYFVPFPFDALYPPAISAIDHHAGRWLQQLSMVRDHAKTYIVRAIRG